MNTVYFKGMMFFALTSQMYHRISVLVPVLARVPEYLSTSTSTSTSTMTLELTSTSTLRVQEMQYSSTASTSTGYEYPSPGADDLVKQGARASATMIFTMLNKIKSVPVR